MQFYNELIWRRRKFCSISFFTIYKNMQRLCEQNYLVFAQTLTIREVRAILILRKKKQPLVIFLRSEYYWTAYLTVSRVSGSKGLLESVIEADCHLWLLKPSLNRSDSIMASSHRYRLLAMGFMVTKGFWLLGRCKLSQTCPATSHNTFLVLQLFLWMWFSYIKIFYI